MNNNPGPGPSIPEKHYDTRTLLRHFAPYYKPYTGTLLKDLFCAGLTTVCELILPMMIRRITDMGMNHIELLTLRYILRIALVYFVLRIVDCAANYYMAYTGHVMGARIETDMQIGRASCRERV